MTTVTVSSDAIWITALLTFLVVMISVCIVAARRSTVRRAKYKRESLIEQAEKAEKKAELYDKNFKSMPAEWQDAIRLFSQSKDNGCRVVILKRWIEKIAYPKLSVKQLEFVCNQLVSHSIHESGAFKQFAHVLRIERSKSSEPEHIHSSEPEHIHLWDNIVGSNPPP